MKKNHSLPESYEEQSCADESKIIINITKRLLEKYKHVKDLKSIDNYKTSKSAKERCNQS